VKFSSTGCKPSFHIHVRTQKNAAKSGGFAKRFRSAAAGTDIAKDMDVQSELIMKKFLTTLFAAMAFINLACATEFAPGQAVGELVVLPTPHLQWSWPYSASNVVFNIYSATNLAAPHSAWTIIGTTASTSFPITLTLPAQYFFVVASNTVTSAVSSAP
jgi:hypothetical protein